MKSRILSGIAGKISVGYAIIIGITLVISFTTYFIVQGLRSTDRELSESIVPSFISLKEFKNLNSISYKLTSNWIYQPSQQDKETLKKLFDTDYPQQAKKFSDILVAADVKNEKANELLKKFEEIISFEKQVAKKLNADSLYSSDVVVDEAINLLTNSIKPAADEFNKSVDEQIIVQENALKAASDQKANSYTLLTITVLLSSFIYALVGAIASLVSVRAIVRPINAVKDIVLSLSRGEIKEVTVAATKDEVGEMVDSIKTLIAGQKSNTAFAINIGDGNYNSEFTPLSEEDQMGNALLEMRSNLKKNAEEDAKRNWATSGLAQIGEILRKTDQRAEEMYDQILEFLIKYLKANQGALFIVEDENAEDHHLKMVGCYAYNRKKFLNQRVDIGEGMVGQCYLEKETIFMKKVPEGYLRITSGLGEATPRCVVIVPLKLNQEIQGVVEIATFQELQQFEIDFVNRLAESIASTITSLRVSERTKALLENLQVQGEQMRAQEEEMRQNMEELSATQEEMARKELEYINKIKRLESSAVA